jgi:hemerythrin-like domain-containing protein
VRRDQSLKTLSRDHHQALFAAQRLRRAGDADVEARALEFLEFWRDRGRRHFRIEEDVLLPAYERFASASEEAVVRVLTDHVTIRRRAADLEQGERQLASLHELGTLLDEHVRHEERVLFPLIEQALPASELESLARAMDRAEAEGS